MRILLSHNFYQQPGGEDSVFRAESALLRDYGHEVMFYTEENKKLSEESLLKGAINTVWSLHAQRNLDRLLAQHQPNIVHFHNTFMRISPAAYYTCQQRNLPVVQTLHNYRLLCPSANFFRDGANCELCMGKSAPLPGIIHGCWQNSKLKSVIPATMLTVHNFLKTWHKQVDMFIVLTEFARRKFIDGGLPADKIIVKPNFLYTDQSYCTDKGEFALFVGRLSPEKGIVTLLRSWQHLSDIPLKIICSGPLSEKLQQFRTANDLRMVEILGWQAKEEVQQLMKTARFLVFQSECYEGFPMTILEAFACGLPVLAPKLGAMNEIITDGVTGIHFSAGDSEDLAAKVRWAWEHPNETRQIGLAGRREYESKYTSEKNYHMLIDIYNKVIARRR